MKISENVILTGSVNHEDIALAMARGWHCRDTLHRHIQCIKAVAQNEGSPDAQKLSCGENIHT